MKLTEEQLARMKHALGMDNKEPHNGVYHAYRNYSVYGDIHPVWDKLVEFGFAEEKREDGDYVYVVTLKGMQAVADSTGVLIRYTMEVVPRDLK